MRGADGDGWPVLIGAMPTPIQDRIARTESGRGLPDRLAPGEVTVLTDHGGHPFPGGTGKTQVAAELARGARSRGEVDLVVWVTAASRDAIVTGYADAVDRLAGLELALARGPDAARTAGTDGRPPARDGEAAAARLVSWLEVTARRWLVVLDGVVEPSDLKGLCPAGRSGQTLITTWRENGAFDGLGANVRRLGAFSRREAVAYVMAAVAGDPDRRLGAVDLCADLECLPLALCWATAVMRERRLGCREYRQQFAHRRGRLGVGFDRYATAAWAMAVECADRMAPVGVAWPVLTLAGLLDAGGGVPAAMLTSPMARAHVGGVRGEEPTISPGDIVDALANLSRLGLVALAETSAGDAGVLVSGATGRASTSGAVHVPAIVRAAVLDTLTREQLDASVIVAAGAATQAWGARGATARIVQQLRDCVVDLYRRTGTLLLVPEIHPALLRAGRSMTSDGLADSATAYWQSVSDGAARALGADHPSCVAARAELARALQQAGKLDAALALLDRVLADRERIGGHADPETAAARVMLMDGCELAGRRDQALAVCRRGLAEAEAALGPGHPATFGAREDLARACLRAGRTREAIALYERTLADRERVLGPDHPDTARSRAELTALGRPGGRRTGPSHVHSPAHDR